MGYAMKRILAMKTIYTLCAAILLALILVSTKGVA